MSPTALSSELAKHCPSIAFDVVWEHDEDACWEGDWTVGEDPDDWQCWQSTVRARLILDGKLLESCAHLCGTWEKSENHPSSSNPDISGYLPQMLEEAVEALQLQVATGQYLDGHNYNLTMQLHDARKLLKEEMQARYETQRLELKNHEYKRIMGQA